MMATSVRFLRNLGIHARLVLAKRETLAEAWAEIRRDSQKVKGTVTRNSDKNVRHRKSARLAERGRKQYNAGKYVEAERLFRDAIIEDPNYALPHTYLGHTLYKQDRLDEALAAWKRAYIVDPASEEGQKAWKKLQGVGHKASKVVEDLEARIRKPPRTRPE